MKPERRWSRCAPPQPMRSQDRCRHTPWIGVWSGLVACALLTQPVAWASRPVSALAQDPRAMLERLLPRSVHDRAGWATDIYIPFMALGIRPTADNACAVIAVIDQESGFRVNPVVPGLPQIALRALDERARSAHVPEVLVDAALALTSSTGRTYRQWLGSARTEKDLSDLFEDFTGKVPLGRVLFARWNPIRTRGPMQVNIDFAGQLYDELPYPYPFAGSLGDELFTRRGSLYFGIAHLLAYRAPYASYLYRFADYNAGQYASRNAAFQNALSVASGVRLVRDGVLLAQQGFGDTPGMTELAAQLLAGQLELSREDIHEALERSRSEALEQTPLYQEVFTLAERTAGHPLPRALVPHIQLRGPKITRRLTTEWYARRVDERFESCERQSQAD